MLQSCYSSLRSKRIWNQVCECEHTKKGKHLFASEYTYRFYYVILHLPSIHLRFIVYVRLLALSRMLLFQIEILARKCSQVLFFSTCLVCNSMLPRKTSNHNKFCTFLMQSSVTQRPFKSSIESIIAAFLCRNIRPIFEWIFGRMLKKVISGIEPQIAC